MKPGERRDLKCPECGARMKLRTSKFGLFYGCATYPVCKAAHGAHPDGSPLGIPANKETKRWRIRAHEEFDKLWKSGNMTRSRAYAVLRQIMRMNKDQAHIGRFTKEECQFLINRLRTWERDSVRSTIERVDALVMAIALRQDSPVDDLRHLDELFYFDYQWATANGLQDVYLEAA